MEQYFASLTKRQSMLLLTAVTFGGDSSLEVLEHLEPVEAELLKSRASELLQIGPEKRIPLLVQEIKRLVSARRRHLAGAAADRLAKLLANERPALIEVMLRALPEPLAAAISLQLPSRGKPPRREVRPEVLGIVRAKLETRLARSAPVGAEFTFEDVLNLQTRELLSLCDRLGARSLAIAIAGLPEEERAGFLNALPPDQRDLASRAAKAGEPKKLKEPDARKALELHGALANPPLGLRSAGTQRIVRAALAESLEFAQRLSAKHHGSLGHLLERWLQEERERPVRGDGGRADLVDQLERLAQKGIVDRPTRLPPLPGAPGTERRAAAQQPKGPLPRPLKPAQPRQARPAPPPLPAPPPPSRRPPADTAQGPQGSGRDPVAERAARRAGAAPAGAPRVVPRERTDGGRVAVKSVGLSREVRNAKVLRGEGSEPRRPDRPPSRRPPRGSKE